MLAIITGTIKPSSSVGQLVIKDEEERFRQYAESLNFFIECGAFYKIIFCDNSNYGIEKFSFLKKTAKEHNVILELISFPGDTSKIVAHGKGYGEGEIMDYVFHHSELVKDEKFFVKITGRMKIDNISKMIAYMEENKTYFNIPNRTIKNIYDTRIYGMPTKQFRDLFAQEYVRVQDDAGVYLEHVYTDILKKNNIKVTNFPRYPRIVGVSGSTGNVYGYTEWKCKIKDVFSYLGFYKVKE